MRMKMRHKYAIRKSTSKLPQKSMLREFAKASEDEIWTRVRRRYLTSFAGLSVLKMSQD